ncbi:MAG: class I SAM-dependent methyltransferase [Candidatus Dormibacteraeota bacterium]|nr:class I SAM-dependent methyltransferase [Candidatus Dormibacteraeota bacterium]
MSVVRDDPSNPDEGFAELYAQLPDATDLSPWLELAQAAAPPVLYLGIGAGRLAVPLHAAGIELVGVDSHPGMLSRLRRRLPDTELIQSRIEDLDLGRRFSLVIVPSNILETVDRLRRAAAHLADGGVLAAELTNPHWLRAGADKGVRVTAFDGNEARFEVDYTLSDGRMITQQADVPLVWPEEVENWLATVAGLKLRRMFARPDAELVDSPSFYVVASK